MRIAHLADLHFGKQALRVSAESGLNQREVDLYDLSDALAAQLIELMPDLVVIAGDLYNDKYPRPVAIQRCHRFLRQLRAAQLPVLIIGGNHDHKHSHQPSPLLLAEEFADCVLFLDQGHWDFEGVRFHCLPFEAVAALTRSEDAELEPFEWTGCNMLVAHAYADGKNISSPPEDVKVPPIVLHDPHFSGVMLGHVHEHTQLDPGGNAYYPGALDRLTFKEAGQRPAFWLHEIDPASGDATADDTPAMTSESIKVGAEDRGPRPFVTIEVTQGELTLEELDTVVLARIDDIMALPYNKGAIITLRVREADPQLRASLYRKQWFAHARTQSALWLEPNFETTTLRELMDADFEDVTSAENGTMQQRWRDFLKKQGREDLLPLATEIYELVASKRKVAIDE